MDDENLVPLYYLDVRFGSFKSLTKLKSMAIEIDHVIGRNAETLPAELPSILSESLEHLLIKNLNERNEKSCHLISTLELLANQRRKSTFTILRPIVLGGLMTGPFGKTPSPHHDPKEPRSLKELCKFNNIRRYFRIDHI